MNLHRYKPKQLTTLEAQELLYKRRLEEWERTKGLTREELIKKANTFTFIRGHHIRASQPSDYRNKDLTR